MSTKDTLRNISFLVEVKRAFDSITWALNTEGYKLTHKSKRQKDYSISFCITCKGRLWQLEQTLRKNIDDNADYDKCNFILIDYNSKDGLEQWIKNNFSKEIENGKLIYFKNNNFKLFQMAHAKNLSHRLAEGEVVVNLDGDNFTNKGFANYVNSMFKAHPNILLHSGNSNGTAGRIAVLKKHFIGVNGYDESFKVNYYEEVDYINRLKRKFGLFEIRIPEKYLENLDNAIKNNENKAYSKVLQKAINANKLKIEENKSKSLKTINPNGYAKGAFVKNFKKKIVLN